MKKIFKIVSDSANCSYIVHDTNFVCYAVMLCRLNPISIVFPFVIIGYYRPTRRHFIAGTRYYLLKLPVLLFEFRNFTR